MTVKETPDSSPNPLDQQAESIAAKQTHQHTPPETQKVADKLQVHQMEDSRAQFYTLFNQAPVGYLVLDSVGNVLRTNTTFCRMIGKGTEEVTGHALNQFIWEEDRDLFVATYRAFYKNPEKKIIETRLYSQEKGMIFTRLEGSLVTLSSTNHNQDAGSQLLLTVSDITNQKMAEAQNFKNEDRLKGLLEIAQYQPRDSQDLLDYALEKAIQLTSSQVGYIFYFDEQSQEFTLNSWSQEMIKQYPLTDVKTVYQLDKTDVWGETVRQRKPIAVNDFTAGNPLKKGYPIGHVELKRFLTIPVFSGSEIVAVVGVGNKPEAYDEGDTRQLTLLMDPVWKMLEKQRTVQSLAESEARFRQVTESINEVFWLRDSASGEMLYVSPKYEEVWGRTCQSLYGNPKSFIESIHPAHRAEAWEKQKQLSEDGIPFDLQYRILRPDDSERWVWARTYPVRDEKDKIIRYAGIAEDITIRKQTEEALRESKERYHSLFTTMQEGFALHEIICDDSGKPVNYRFLDINPSFERLTGLRAEFLIGKTVLDILPNTESYWIDQYGEVALTSVPKNFEDFSSELGKHYEVNVYSPKQGLFAVIFSDVTERKRAELEGEKLISDLEQKNAELEQFTYTVSHDLKSPLITIKGFLGLLEQDAEEGNLPQVKNDIQRIGSAADKMKSLLDDLLELSRIGRIANPSSMFSFLDVVNEVVELLSGRIQASGVKVEKPIWFPAVFGDRARIREVVQNLLENAIKYMGDQPDPCIEIGFTPNEKDTHFFVKDNGMGIDRRYLDKVFGLFEKLDSHSEGTGVGLALVRRIIDYHGGKVWVESAGKDQGSTFTFSLPNPSPEMIEDRSST